MAVGGAALGITLAEAGRRLARRARWMSLAVFLLVATPFAGLGLASFFPFGSAALGFGVTIAFTGLVVAAAVALLPWMNARDVVQAVASLQEIPGLTVVEIRGSYIPRLTCSIPLSGNNRLTIQFVGGFASEYMAENSSFVLSLPWNLPADVMAFRNRTYSDLPAVLSTIEELRRTLDVNEHVWSNTVAMTIESKIVPRWRFRRSAPGYAKVISDRILERGQALEAILTAANAETRFRPSLIRHPGRFPGMLAPFSIGAWCLSCRRSVSIWDSDSDRRCPRCGHAPMKVLSRGHLDKKMKIVEATGYRISMEAGG